MKAAVVTRERTLSRPIHSARQTHSGRTDVALVLRSGDAYGVGVAAPQPLSIMGDPGVYEVLDSLQSVGLSRLSAVGRSDQGRMWAHATSLFSDLPRDRWTAAIVESALLDLESVEANRTWSDILGGGATSFQSVGSLVGGNHEVQINPLAARYRIKVSHSSIGQFEDLLALEAPVVLDFNGDVPEIEVVHSSVSEASRYATIVGVEQAWAIGDFDRPAALRQAGIRVFHDESMRSVQDLRHAIRYGAIDECAIKPARCGGIAVSREIARRARAAGVEIYVGGFFESPLGRFRNHLLAMSLQAGPSDVLDVVTGIPVTAQEAEQDKQSLVELAEKQGEWIEVGG